MTKVKVTVLLQAAALAQMCKRITHARVCGRQ